MPVAPVGRLKKKEIVWLANHKCLHYHTYLDHYTCFISENPLQQRMGVLDTENSALDAEWGIMLCYCIKVLGKKKIYQRQITKNELLSDKEDSEVVRSCIKDIKKFDRVITYYGTGYDLPFIRTRAMVNKIPFPFFGALHHTDVYYIVRGKFRLKRNRQENACRVLLGRTLKTHVNPKIWRKALQGNKKQLDWILDHCQRDVKDLELLYNKVMDFSKGGDTSI